MKQPLITALLAGAALLCTEMANAAEQPVVSGNDMAYMKQQQRDLELFKSQLKGMNITLPDAQQGRVSQLQNEIAAAQADQNSAARPTPRAVYFVSLGIPGGGAAADACGRTPLRHTGHAARPAEQRLPSDG